MALQYEDLDLLLHTIKNCVCAELERVREKYPDVYPGCPCFACVVTGEATWDHCNAETMNEGTDAECVCGQLTVSLDRVYPYSTFGDTTFPIQQQDIVGLKPGCIPSGLAADINVTLLRCSAAPEEGELTVACDVLERQAWINSMDIMVLINSVICCLNNGEVPNNKNRRYLIQQANPLNSEGMCEGSEMLITVDLGVPCPCPELVSP